METKVASRKADEEGGEAFILVLSVFGGPAATLRLTDDNNKQSLDLPKAVIYWCCLSLRYPQ